MKHLTWQQAREFCMKENGNLASIGSEEEHRYIYETYVKEAGSKCIAVAGPGLAKMCVCVCVCVVGGEGWGGKAN